MSRLELDERVGCIAVVDRTQVRSPGLARGYPGVLAFWHGRPATWLDRFARHDPHLMWVVPSKVRRAARRRLAELEKSCSTDTGR